MNKNKRYICFTHHEHLILMRVVGVTKDNALRQGNKAEARMMSDLTEKLLRYELDDGGTAVSLDGLSRYVLWNAMETYAAFCSETQRLLEYTAAVTIITKLK